MELGFDNEKYLKIQKEKIEERIKMFDNQKFLNDLYLYCSHRDIKFYELTYTEQLACIRSMLVCITRKKKL